jgi:hypothetical protein
VLILVFANGVLCLDSGAPGLSVLIGVPDRAGPGTRGFKCIGTRASEKTCWPAMRLMAATHATMSLQVTASASDSDVCHLRYRIATHSSPIVHGALGPGMQMMAAQLRSPPRWASPL